MDLEEIIRRIIAIEDKAQEIVHDAREASDSLNERVDAADKRIAQNIRYKAEERCRKMRETEQESIRGKIESINERANEQLESLEKKYNENKEKWVDEMARHIIGE